MPTEADTCRKFVVPALHRAGWENDPHSIGEQRPFNDGRIVPRGKGYIRRPPKRADYLLFYRRDFPIAVVEAEKEGNYGTASRNSANSKDRRADLEPRSTPIEAHHDRGIDFQTLALQAGKPDADPFDLHCHLAFNAPVLTSRQRVDRVRREEGECFAQFGQEAFEILGELLEKYSEDGELQFTLPDVLKVAPISEHGNVQEIVGKFDGPSGLRIAINELQRILYVA